MHAAPVPDRLTDMLTRLKLTQDPPCRGARARSDPSWAFRAVCSSCRRPLVRLQAHSPINPFTDCRSRIVSAILNSCR